VGSCTTTDVDRSEVHNLAAEEPERLQEIINLWYAEAGANGAFPLDDRSAPRDHHHTAAPCSARPRNRYVYYPGVAEVPESQAVNLRKPLVRDRGGGGHPEMAMPQGVPVRPWRSLRRALRSTSRTNRLKLRLQLRRHAGAARRGRREAADRRRADPLRRVREGTVRTPPRRLDRHAVRCTTATRRVGEARHQDAAPASFAIAGEGPDHRAGQQRARDRRLPRVASHTHSRAARSTRVAVDVSGEAVRGPGARGPSP